MNKSYSHLHPSDELLELRVVDNSYKVKNLKNIESTDICPVCKKKLEYGEADGDFCCKKCGAVLDKSVFTGMKEEDDDFKLNAGVSGWDSQYSKTNVGAYGDRTVIGKGKKDFKAYDGKEGKKLYGEQKKQLAKLRDTTKFVQGEKHVRSWEELNQQFKDLLVEIIPGSINPRTEEPKPIAETAILLFQKCLRKGLQKGQRSHLVMTNCIRLAQKLHGKEIDFHSVDDDLGWRMKNFQMYRKIKSELGIEFYDYENELVYKNVHEITTKICNVKEFIDNRKIFNEALDIIETASEDGITGGKVPQNLAAAAVFLSCIRNGHQISRYEMAENVKASSTTIQNIAKELNDKLRLDISL